MHATFLISLFLAAAAASPYRFDRPEVLDLTEPQRLAPLQGARVPPTPLPPEISAQIVKAPEVGLDAPVQMQPSGEDSAAARKSEAARIAPEAPSVRRTGMALTIATRSGRPARFEDWVIPSRRDAGGDSEAFLYLGRVGAAGYHRVEVRFGHDAPGSFLVHPATGRMAFVHNGGDVVALSPGGTRVLSLHTMNAPHLLAVTALDAAGPTLALQCRDDGQGVRAIVFKGWQGEDRFAITLDGAPMLVTFEGGQWTVSAPAPQAGYACWVSLPASTP